MTSKTFDSGATSLSAQLDDPSTCLSQSTAGQESPAILQELQLSRREGQSKPAEFCFPLTVLDVVLDILEQHREAAVVDDFGDALVGKTFSDAVYSKRKAKAKIAWTTACLRNISLVQRSWTRPAQRSLGRIIYVLGPHHYHSLARRLLDNESSPTIFGPWTSSIAISNIGNREYEHKQFGDVIKFLFKPTQNVKGIYIRNFSDMPRSTIWANSILKRIVGLNIAPQHLVIWSVFSWESRIGTIKLDSLLNSSELTKRLQYLDLREAVYKGGAICADLSSLRGITFSCSTDDSIRTLVSLLACVSSSLNSPFDSLTICDIDRDGKSAMDREGLFSKCVDLWPRLRRLHLAVDHDDRNEIEDLLDGVFQPMAAHCINLKEFDIKTNMFDFTKALKHLPPGLRELHICLTTPYNSGILTEPEAETIIVDHVFQTMWLPLLLPLLEKVFSIRVVYTSYYQIEGYGGKPIAYDKAGREGHTLSFRFIQGQLKLGHWREINSGMDVEYIASVIQRLQTQLGEDRVQ